MREHIRRFALVRDAVGETTVEERQRIATHLEGCATCREAAAEVRANVSEYEADRERHFAVIRDKLQAARPEPRRAPPWRRIWPVVATAAMAVGLAVALVRPGSDPVQYKGELAMQVVAKRGERQFVVHDGQELFEGDALRFVVTVGAPGYLTLFSVDGRGVVTPFYPGSAPRTDPAPLTLERSGPHELPGAIELDDAIGDEVVIAVLSAEPFSRTEVHEAFRRLVVDKHAADLTAPAAGVAGDVALLRFTKPPPRRP